MARSGPDVPATRYLDEVDGVLNDGVVMGLMGRTCVGLKPVEHAVGALAYPCPLANPKIEE